MLEPVCIFTLGIHGNEFSPRQAVQFVQREIAEKQIKLFGSLVVLEGNPEATLRRQRFIDVDLNRLWTAERMSILERGAVVEQRLHEHQAQQELFSKLEPYLRRKTGTVTHVDLHTTSGVSAPFCAGEFPGPGCAFARSLVVPFLRVSGKRYKGMLTRYVAQRGHVSCIVEGGKEGSSFALEVLITICWIALFRSGVLGFDSFENAEAFLERKCRFLQKLCSLLPSELEMFYVHSVKPDDQFRMKEGFSSFQTVSAGQLIADDKRGPIYAHGDAHLLFPLYQPQGSEGFVLARKPLSIS